MKQKIARLEEALKDANILGAQFGTLANLLIQYHKSKYNSSILLSKINTVIKHEIRKAKIKAELATLKRTKINKTDPNQWAKTIEDNLNKIMRSTRSKATIAENNRLRGARRKNSISLPELRKYERI